MNILITGCNGQLGNEMQLLEKENTEHRWFNTDVEELDITNQLAVEQFVAQNKIDGIVNCAAYTAVDKAESEKELCTTLNTVSPAYLAAAIEKRGGWMIQISTDYVFNGTNIHLIWRKTRPALTVFMDRQTCRRTRRSEVLQEDHDYPNRLALFKLRQ